jgi:prolyl-tRNA editing enzyme YbaK/EbsC (Cys-tRNA(Pro) deacylase)
VAPFGLPQPMRILADPSIFTPDEVSIGSGVRGTTIVMQTADLRRALPDVEIVELQE